MADQTAGAGASRPRVRDLAGNAVRILASRGLTVASAESLTGGMLGAAITAVPGASRVYRGGVVAYATDVKHTLLGVDAALLARVGAVHPDVAAQLAAGVRVRLNADIGLATTGVAGPDPQDGQQPGTVWIAVADGSGTVVVDASTAVEAAGARLAIRRHTVRRALQSLLERLGT